MNEPLLEIEFTQPGRLTGQYYPIEYDSLRLERLIYLEVKLPFDIGILPKTMSSSGNPLKVIL